MNCSDFEQSIALYVDGGLGAAERARVKEHLAGCAQCASFAQGLEGDRRRLREEPPEMSDVNFAAIRREMWREIGEQQRWSPWWLAGVAAVVLLLALWRPWVSVGPQIASIPATPSGPRAGTNSPENVAPVPSLRHATASTDAGGRPSRRPRSRASTSGQRASTGGRQDPRPPEVPQPDPVLEQALQEFIAAEKEPVRLAAPSAVEIRIVSHDPNVVLIMLQESSGASYE